MNSLTLCELSLLELPNLSSLETLDQLVIKQVLLNVLSVGIANAPRLSTLKVIDCSRLKAIPADFIGRLSQQKRESDVSAGLTKLVMMNLPCVCEVPAEICKLKKLPVRAASNFSPRHLSEGIAFHGVEKLSLIGHHRTSSIFTMRALSLCSIVKLKLQDTHMLQMPSLLLCTNLVDVSLKNLLILRLLIRIPDAPKLKILAIHDCMRLGAIDVAFIRRLTQVTAESPDHFASRCCTLSDCPI